MAKGVGERAGGTGPKKSVDLHNVESGPFDRATMASPVVLWLRTECCARDCKAVLLLVNKCDLTLKLVGLHFNSLAVFLRCVKESLVEPLATPVSDSRLMWYISFGFGYRQN